MSSELVSRREQAPLVTSTRAQSLELVHRRATEALVARRAANVILVSYTPVTP